MRFYAALWAYAAKTQQCRSGGTRADPTEAGCRFLESIDVSETLTFSTVLHGGFGECTFKAIGARDKTSMRFRAYLNAHVVVFDFYQRRVFEGFVSNTSISDGGLEVTATGYYAKAGNVTVTLPKDTLAWNAKTYDYLSTCIDLVKEWNPTSLFVQYANYQIGNQLDFSDHRKVRDVIENVMQYGFLINDTTTHPGYFAIWDHRVAHAIRDSSGTSYPNWFVKTLSLDKNNAGVTLSMDGVFNKVAGYYKSSPDAEGPSLSPWSSEKLSQARYGVKEGILQNNSPEGLPMWQSLSLSALERYAMPRQVCNLEITGVIQHSGGFIDYPYRIRAGQHILITDLDTFAVNSGNLWGLFGQGLLGFVLRTEYDANSNTTSVEFGTTDQTFDALMTRLGLSGGLS